MQGQCVTGLTDVANCNLAHRTLPAAGTSVVWKCKGIYDFNDEHVGQWSDVASISVMD